MSRSLFVRLTFLLVALSFGAVGCNEANTSASGTPGNADGEAYSKKLVGVWEGTEEMMPGDKPESVTVEFKTDGGFKSAMGPFDMSGTWKLLKEDGKTVTIETEVTLKGFGEGKTDKKTFTIVFEDGNSVVMSRAGDKQAPKKLKRKS
jgi:hypothetical protein